MNVFISCSKKTKTIKTLSFLASDTISLFEQTAKRYPIEYDSTSQGVFVRTIDGINSGKSAFWLYYVNNKPGKVAADRFIPAVGDTIEWRLISGY